MTGLWYYDPTDLDKPKLGHWLGAALNVGQGLAYYVLTDKGTVKTWPTVSPLTVEDNANADTKRLMSDFTASVESNIGNYCNATQSNISNNSVTYARDRNETQW